MHKTNVNHLNMSLKTDNIIFITFYCKLVF